MSTAVHLALCVEKYSVKLAHGHLQTNHDGRLSRHLKKERPNDFDFRVTFTETGCSTCFIWIRLRRKKSWISGVFTRCPFWWPREKLELSPQEYASCKPIQTQASKWLSVWDNNNLHLKLVITPELSNSTWGKRSFKVMSIGVNPSRSCTRRLALFYKKNSMHTS